MRRRQSLIVTSVLAAAGLSLLAAGCGGGGGSPGVASVASTTPAAAPTSTTQSAAGALLAFARCMRTHGVPNFADPQRFAGGNVKLTIHQLAPAPASLTACSYLLPSSGGSGTGETPQELRVRVADGLSFATCMRGHGVSRFPDPTTQGQLTVEMVEAQGIDVHAPTVLRAVEACLPASHGLLTAAKVAEALSEAGG